jgi:hypothetical protein
MKAIFENVSPIWSIFARATSVLSSQPASVRSNASKINLGNINPPSSFEFLFDRKTLLLGVGKGGAQLRRCNRAPPRLHIIELQPAADAASLGRDDAS